MKKALLGICLVAAAIVIYLICTLGNINDWAIDASKGPDWIPPGASNVTYVRTNLSRAAEFDIPFTDFSEWCSQMGRAVNPVTESSKITIGRANLILATKGRVKQPEPPADTASETELQQWLNWSRVTLDDEDYFYQEVQSNNGGLSLGYDTSEQRAYYFYSHN